MTPEQAKAYERLRAVPNHGQGPRSAELLQRMFEERHRAHVAANARAAAAMEPAFGELRSAFSTTPGVRDALNRVKKPEVPKLPAKHVVKPRKEPFVRIGSMFVTDVPPFQGLTGQSGTGDNVIETNADGPAGSMGFSLSPGVDDNGSAQCWCAIGQEYVTPSEALIFFSSDPSLSWMCDWMSTWWRQAAGTIWIGQVVNMWDLTGNYLGTPISTQNNLFSYNDYNLADTGVQTGESSGDLLLSSFVCPASVVLECWVVIGGYANADGSNTQSASFNQVKATVPSLQLNVWT